MEFDTEEFERICQILSGSEKLEINIHPGTASPQKVGVLLGEISKLYMMMGGSGIEFRLDQVSILKDFEHA